MSRLTIVRNVFTGDDATRVRDEMASLVENLGYGERNAFRVRMCLEEALANGRKHGHHGDETRAVRLRCTATPWSFRAKVTDEGQGFDPLKVPDPRRKERLERPCGRGLLFLRTYTDDLRYNRRGNSVSFRIGTAWWLRTWYRLGSQLHWWLRWAARRREPTAPPRLIPHVEQLA